MIKFKKSFISAFIVLNCFCTFVYGFSNTEEMDSLRANLACQKNKTSKEYVKTKAKLDKMISGSHLDRSAEGRFLDVTRMINEKKINAAIYELEDMIENNIAVSKSYEYLAGIYLNFKNNRYKAAEYLRYAIEADEMNESATLTLAKLYIQNKKNILGTELLKKVIEISQSKQNLYEVENIILRVAIPQDKYEANNLYEALGMMYLKAGRNFDSYAAYKKAIDSNPSDIALKYYLANLLYTDNQTDSLISLYTNILKNNPNDNQIRANRAKLFVKKGNVKDAHEEYSKILSEYPQSNQAKYGIYQIYKNTLTPEKIFQKFNISSAVYLPDKEEVASFIEFLNGIGDYEAVELFKNYLKECEIRDRELIRLEEERKALLLREEELRIQREKEEELKRLEQRRLERERIEQERQAKLEQERQAKLEQERLEQLEKQRIEQERLAKIEQEKKIQIEQERLLQLEQERAQQLTKQRIEKERLIKLEQERLEQLEKQRIEQEKLIKLEQEKKIQVEQDRIQQLEQERQAKLEQERLEQLEKQKLEQERQAQLEQERQAKLEQERLEQLEKQKLEQERKAQLEQERLEKENSSNIQA